MSSSTMLRAFTLALLLLQSAHADIRMFMSRDGEQHDQPTTGPTSIDMAAGESLRVVAWVAFDEPVFLVNAYQVIMKWNPQPLPGATGTVEYVDNPPFEEGPDTLLIDTMRDDWFFADLDAPVLSPAYNETPDPGFMGAFYSTIPGAGIEPAGLGIRYLVQFFFRASQDASGQFEARFQTLEPPITAFFSPIGSGAGADICQPLIINITSCKGACDDANACTADDQCIDGTCVGTPPNCTEFDEECALAACDPADKVPNCLAREPINEGQTCDGGSGVCTDGICQHVFNTTRMFMARDVQQHTQPEVGATHVAMGAGEKITIMAWYEDITPDDELVGGYQLVIPWTATPLENATGSIGYVDNKPAAGRGDSVFLDTKREDWLFADAPPGVAVFSENVDNGWFGVFYALGPNQSVDPTNANPKYLLAFDVQATPDADGQFELRFNIPPSDPPPYSRVFDDYGSDIRVGEFQPLIITISGCGGPCDDGQSCTENDQCVDGICVGDPIDCSAFDTDCAIAGCDPSSTDGACSIMTPTNEGQLCDDTTGVCQSGECVPITDRRVFMARDGEQAQQPSEGITTVTMTPGETVRVAAFLEDNGALLSNINGYQLLFPTTPQPLDDAGGSVLYVDDGEAQGGSIFLDHTRSDWLFIEEPALTTAYNETPECGFFGMFYGLPAGSSVDPEPGLHYLVEFELQASVDACGVFESRFRLPPLPLPQSILFHGAGFSHIALFQPLHIEVVDCTGAPCAEPCDDANVCTADDQCVDGVCAGQAVDCSTQQEDCRVYSCDPDGCQSNCDIWTPINDGLPCGDEGVCVEGNCEPLGGRARVFMSLPGMQDLMPGVGPTTVSMPAGVHFPVRVWIEDNAEAGDLLAGARLRVPRLAEPWPGSTGTVSYEDNEPFGEGDTVEVDTEREDWIFADVYQFPPQPLLVELEAVFGVTHFNEEPVDPTIYAGPRYLFEFRLEISDDAEGLFTLPFAAITEFFGPRKSPFNVDEWQPLIILVGAPQPQFSIPPNGGTFPSGSTDPDGPRGPDMVVVELDGPGVELSAGEFLVSVSDGETPSIADFEADGDSVMLHFDRPLPPGECTTITHLLTGWSTSLRSLPGDVNGDGTSGPLDILTLIDHLNGALADPLATWQCDIDGSGLCNGLDVLVLIDLLNGAGGTMPWNGVTAPPCP